MRSLSAIRKALDKTTFSECARLATLAAFSEELDRAINTRAVGASMRVDEDIYTGRVLPCGSVVTSVVGTSWGAWVTLRASDGQTVQKRLRYV